MANGFRDYDGFTPNRFIAKAPAGNDSNDGLTKNTPVVTFPRLSSLLIGSGIYQLSNDLFSGLYGDGKVIINCNNQVLRMRGNVFNIEFFNLGRLQSEISTRIYRNVSIKNSLSLTISDTGFKFYNSFFINNIISNIGTISVVSFVKSILKDTTCFTNSNFIFRLINSFVDANSEVNINRHNDLINSNINGIISINGTFFNDSLIKKYVIKDQLVGTPQDNGYPIGVNWLTEAQLTADGYTGTIIGWDAAVATCINRDPKFNNVALEDFSLQADSPHIGRASDGGNIGGTDIANTVLVSQNGVGTIEINPQPRIDTTNPNFYTVATNEDEGYIDIIQRLGTQPLVLTEIEPISTLEFDSDIAGGSVGNQDVPDSEPQTAEYPRKLTTTSLAPDAFTLNVTAHDVVVGEFVRVAGEDRQVTAVATNTITVGTAFRAAVASGVEFQAGSEVQLAALRPNRLTYQLRVSTQALKPAIDSEWDNNIDPIYNYSGLFSTQEWYAKPGYVIENGNVFGTGDAEANPTITPDEIAATWINVRVWLRNNYAS